MILNWKLQIFLPNAGVYQVMITLGFFFLWVFASAEDLDTALYDLQYPKLGEDVVKAHMKCFLDSGPCDHISLSMKQTLKEDLYTKCGRCSDAEKKKAWQFLMSVEQIIPFELDKWKNKVDPNKKYFDDFMLAIQPNDFK